MLIDWFTVIAQAFNFILLVWLLKRFLYKPVLAAVEAREQKIAKELKDADATKADAQKERDEFQHKNEDLEKQRQTLVGKATEEAAAERGRLLDAAHHEADALRSKLEESVNSERGRLGTELASRAQQEVLAIARKALGDLADDSLEERIAALFIRRLQELDDAQKGKLKVLPQGPPAILRSATELAPAQRAALEAALKPLLAGDLQFEVRPELVSGIELTVNGQKLAWSIADYLSSLAKSLDILLAAKEPVHAD